MIYGRFQQRNCALGIGASVPVAEQPTHSCVDDLRIVRPMRPPPRDGLFGKSDTKAFSDQENDVASGGQASVAAQQLRLDLSENIAALCFLQPGRALPYPFVSEEAARILIDGFQ